MLTYKLDKDPYDSEIMFTGKLERTISPGITVLVGCNGYGKSTILETIKRQYKRNDDYKIFSWNGRSDKEYSKQRALDSQNYGVLSSLAFSSEGEEININIGVLASGIGHFVRQSKNKNVIILLDGIDSGLSIDNIIETKEFFKELVIPDIEETGHDCYVVLTANEYELVKGERCIDARDGKEVHFGDYKEYRKYILKTKEKKEKRRKTR